MLIGSADAARGDGNKSAGRAVDNTHPLLTRGGEDGILMGLAEEAECLDDDECGMSSDNLRIGERDILYRADKDFLRRIGEMRVCVGIADVTVNEDSSSICDWLEDAGDGHACADDISHRPMRVDDALTCLEIGRINTERYCRVF